MAYWLSAIFPMWQARNIAEHAHCPPLFCFMQVEGEFLPSTDTEQGVAVHRRVDKPSAAPEAEPETDGAPERFSGHKSWHSCSFSDSRPPGAATVSDSPASNTR